MLRKFAIAMFATTILAGPVLAADAAKPAAAAPQAPLAATTTPATPAAATPGSTNAPAVVSTGKNIKTKAPVTPHSKAANTHAGAAPATEVKTIKADKHFKIVKVAIRSHRHHSHAWYEAHRYYWYMAHRDRHLRPTMTARLSKPVKHVYLHRQHHEVTPVVKAKKDVPSAQPATPVVKANKDVPSKTQ